MNLYIFDTDHLSLYGRNHPTIVSRLSKSSVLLTTTVINVEEMLRGRLAQVAETRKENGTRHINAYQRLIETLTLISEFQILQFDSRATETYQFLKARRIRVGTQDLKIASVVIANKGVLLTRNKRDFERIPNLHIEDWTV